MRWYVVHTYSGFEKAVVRSLKEHIRNAGMEEKFGEILVPTEEVVEMKSGQKRTSERKFFPGYVLSGTSLIKGDVPELKINLVAVGQSCVTKFYGLPGQTFISKVKSLAPALSAEQHTLRVFFELPDPNNKFKPGMYAEIGLGTDPRMAILVPSDAVLHSRNADFVFIGDGPGLWKITEVWVGESIGDRVEILQGLQGGEKIIGNGALLLKPMLVQALLNEEAAKEMKLEGAAK